MNQFNRDDAWYANQAKKRSPDYATKSPQEQWEEDKAFGILDWDGKVRDTHIEASVVHLTEVAEYKELPGELLCGGTITTSQDGRSWTIFDRDGEEVGFGFSVDRL